MGCKQSLLWWWRFSVGFSCSALNTGLAVLAKSWIAG